MRAPRNPVPPCFRQMMARSWHWGALASPAQGSVRRTFACQAVVAPGSFAALAQCAQELAGQLLGYGWMGNPAPLSRRVRPAPAPKSDGLFLSLCDPTGFRLTCRASQTCSTLSVSLMNLTQSWKTDRERMGRGGTQTCHPLLQL